MSSSSNIVGGIAALGIEAKANGDSANGANTGSANSASNSAEPSKVTVQHLDQAASQAVSSPSGVSPGVSTPGHTTMVATPKTMKWSTIIVLLTIGFLGLIAVLVYSLVKPGSSK